MPTCIGGMITRGEGDLRGDARDVSGGRGTPLQRVLGMDISGAGVESVELAGPVEDTGVGGEKSVAFQGGGYDDSVGGVCVEIR